MIKTADATICLIIGDPVFHSLSPLMHNSAYRELGIDDRLVYTAARVEPANLEDAIKGIKALNIKGVSVTVPHKEKVMKYLDEIDETAKTIKAVNTIVNKNGRLIGSNTDWTGAIEALNNSLSTDKLRNKKTAVLGAGGAARAIIYGLKRENAYVKIFNRTIEKAEVLAEEFGVTSGKLSDLKKESKNFDIIVNTTSLGMGKLKNSSPIAKEYVQRKHIVFDIVYNPIKTRLLKDAESVGAQVIHGSEMLLYQGVAQFQMFTGLKAPVDTMRDVLYSYLRENE